MKPLAWPRTLVRLVPIVGGASLVSVLGLIVFRAIVPGDRLANAGSEIGNYLQTVGSIYAVLLAFIVYVVWQQFNDARSFVDREASALIDLHRTASGLPNGSRVAIQRELSAYLEAVLADEWQAMARHDEATITRVGHHLDEVWVEIHRCRPDDHCQHTIYGEVLTRFSALTDLRTSRLTSARFRVPRTMKVLLYTGAVILVGSLYLMYIADFWLHALITAALGGAIAHILYLIADLDDAFAGNLQIERAPFERAREAFARVESLLPPKTGA